MSSHNNCEDLIVGPLNCLDTELNFIKQEGAAVSGFNGNLSNGTEHST
jgi:hypothetical protein